MSKSERRHSRRVLRPMLAFAALAALGVVLAPTGSAGTTNKPFAATFGSTVVPAQPGHPTIGSAGNGYVTLTIKDEARNQGLGSANVYAPAGVTITGTDAPAANLDPTQQPFPAAGTNTLELRNLNLTSTSSPFTTTVYVSAPSCGTFTWNIDAHQSNDYNSLSGNTLSLDSRSSSLTSFNPSGCSLSWTWKVGTTSNGPHEPASANTSPAVVTDTAYTPSTCSPQPCTPPASSVQVALVDGSGTLVDISGPTVTLAMSAGQDLNGNVISTSPFTGDEAQLSHGIATFGSLESIQTGEFQLQPTSSGLASPDPSAPFEITDSGQSCIGMNPCVLDTTVGGSPVDITASSGNFLFLGTSAAQIPASVTDKTNDLAGCRYFTGTGGGFAVTDGRNGDGTLDITISIKNKDLKQTYGPNYGQPNVPICAGAKRLDANNQPVDCTGDQLGGFADRTLAPDGTFNGGYGHAQCGAGGYWWGILGTFQDPLSFGFDSSSIPLITAWGSSPDGVYRTFTVHEPGASTNAPYGWDGHFGY